MNLTVSNPDPTTSYINANDRLSAVDQIGGLPLSVSNATTPFSLVPPGISGPTLFKFENNPVFNNATYTSTATVNGVKSPPPYRIGAAPTPIATDTKTEKVSWA